MSRFKLVHDRHAQGLAAYRAGHSIKDVCKITEEIEAMHEKPDLSDDEHDEIAASTPSFLLGFADGFLEDFRRMSSARRGATA
jgi:hypothetical protein